MASRKFWAALIGLAMIIVKSYAPSFPLTDAQVANLVYVLIAYILGTAIEDAGAAKGSGLVAAVESLLGVKAGQTPDPTPPAPEASHDPK